MKITSRPTPQWVQDDLALQAYHDAYKEVQAEAKRDRDVLVEHLSDFLEIRIREEITELREDIVATQKLNDELMFENTSQSSQIGFLLEQMENQHKLILKLAEASGEPVSIKVSSLQGITC